MMKSLRKSWKKVLALLVAETFLLPGLLYGAKQDISVDISEQIGRVTDHYAGNGGRTIIHIEDAHCNQEAQQNIYRILGTLFNDNDELSFVGIEGAATRVDTAPFAQYPDQNAKWKACLVYVRNGFMSGAELYSISLDPASGRSVALEGIEDPALYIENYETLLAALPLIEESKEYVAALHHTLTSLKNYMFSTELLQLDTTIRLFEQKALSFSDYYRYIYSLARQLGVDMNEYPDFASVADSLRIEDNIDMLIKMQEEQALLDRFNTELNRSDLLRWNELQNRHITGMASLTRYYLTMDELAEKYNLDLGSDTGLARFIEFVQINSRINQEQLYVQMNDLRTVLKKALYNSPEEEKLDYFARHTGIIQSMCDLKVSGEDFAYYQQNKHDFSTQRITSFIRAYAPKYNMAYFIDPNSDVINRALPLIEEFYLIARERNETLLQNALSEMDILGVQTGIIITGGFHTYGISRYMRERGISYYAIAPNIARVERNNPYLDIMTHEAQSVNTDLASSRDGAALAVPSVFAEQILLDNLYDAQSLQNGLKLLMIENSIRSQLELQQGNMQGVQNAIRDMLRSAAFDEIELQDIIQINQNTLRVILNVRGIDAPVSFTIDLSSTPDNITDRTQPSAQQYAPNMSEVMQEGPFNISQQELARIQTFEWLEQNFQELLNLRSIPSNITAQQLIVSLETLNAKLGQTALNNIRQIQALQNTILQMARRINNEIAAGNITESIGDIRSQLDAIADTFQNKIGSAQTNIADQAVLDALSELQSEFASEYRAIMQQVDSHLAKTQAKINTDIDQVIKEDIEEGRAVRISLNQLKTLTPSQIIAEVFEGTTAQVAERLQSLFFGTLSPSARNNLEQQLSNPVMRRQLRAGLQLALDLINNSSYDYDGFALTLLLDQDGVFYDGEALAHGGKAGQQAKNIYLNLSTLVFIAEQEAHIQADYQQIFQAVIEHEYRDVTRGGHVNDIGKVDVLKIQTVDGPRDLTFADVQQFWNDLLNRERETSEIRQVNNQPQQFLRFQRDGIELVVSTKVLEALGLISASEFADLLTGALEQRGEGLNTYFSSGQPVVIDDLQAFQQAHNVDLVEFSPILPIIQRGERLAEQEKDMNISRLAAEMHSLTNQQIQMMFENGLITLQYDKNGEKIYIMDAIFDAWQLSHAGLANNAVYADSPAGAAHELVELRLWRQFGQEVLGFSEQDIENGMLRAWIRKNLQESENSAEFIRSLEHRFHLIAKRAEYEALPLNSRELNDTLFDEISQVVDSVISRSSSYLKSLYFAARIGGAEVTNLGVNTPEFKLMIKIAGELQNDQNKRAQHIALQLGNMRQAQEIAADIAQGLKIDIGTLKLSPGEQQLLQTLLQQEGTYLRTDEQGNLSVSPLIEPRQMSEQVSQKYNLDATTVLLLSNLHVINQLDQGLHLIVADKLAERELGAVGTALTDAVAVILSLDFQNPVKQKILQAIIQARVDTVVSVGDAVLSVLIDEGFLSQSVRSLPMEKKYRELQKALSLINANPVLNNGRTREIYIANLAGILTPEQQEIITRMRNEGKESLAIVKEMERLIGNTAAVNTAKNKAYIAQQLEDQLLQVGRASEFTQEQLAFATDLIYSNLNSDGVADFIVTLNTIPDLVNAYINGAVLKQNLVNAALVSKYVTPMLNALEQGDLSKVTSIVEMLKTRPFQRRVLDQASMNQLITIIQQQVRNAQSMTTENKLSFLALVTELAHIIPGNFSEITAIEVNLQNLVGEIILSQQSSIQQKRAALIKLQQFYDNIAIPVDSSFIRRMERIVDYTEQQDLRDIVTIINLNHELSPQAIVAAEQQVGGFDNFILTANLDQRMVDRIYSSLDALSPMAKQAAQFGLIFINASQDLSSAEKESLYENFMQMIDGISSLTISDQAKSGLITYILRLLGSSASTGRVGLLDTAKAVVMSNAIVELAKVHGEMIGTVLMNSNIQVMQNLPGLSMVHSDGSIILDQSVLGNSAATQIELLRQIMRKWNNFSDSLSDSIIHEGMVLDYIQHNLNPSEIQALQQFYNDTPLLSIAEGSARADLIGLSLASEIQQAEIIGQYLMQNTLRQQGYTELEISTMQAQIEQELEQVIPRAQREINNLNIQQNLDIQISNGILSISGNENRSFAIPSFVPVDQITYMNYEPNTGQVRIVTQSQQVFIFDAATGTQIIQTTLSDTVPGVSWNVQIDMQIDSTIRTLKEAGQTVHGTVGDRHSSLTINNMPIGDYIRQTFPGSVEAQHVADLIDQGNVDIVITDVMPGQLVDSNQFVYAHRDIESGQGTIFISSQAWQYLNPSQDLTLAQQNALVGALINAGITITQGSVQQFSANYSDVAADYRALFLNQLNDHIHIATQLQTSLQQIEARAQEIQAEREVLAQQLIRQKELLAQRNQDRQRETPSVNLKLGDKAVNIEQWNLDELGGKEYAYIEIDGKITVIDIANLTQREFDGVRIEKRIDQRAGEIVSENIVISYRDEANSYLITLLKDSTGELIGHSMTTTDLNGNAVTTVYNNVGQGELLHEFNIELPQTVQAAHRSDQRQALRQEIQDLRAQTDRDQASNERLVVAQQELINQMLATRNQAIDFSRPELANINLDSIYDEISANAQLDDIALTDTVMRALMQQGATSLVNTRSASVQSVVIDGVQYDIDLAQGGKIQFSEFSVNSNDVKKLPDTHIENNRLIVYDSQGRRFEFGLNTVTDGTTTSTVIGEFIGVANMLDRNVQKQLGVDMQLEQYIGNRNEKFERINQQIKRVETEIGRLQGLYLDAMSRNDSVAADNYAGSILQRQAEIQTLNMQLITTQNDFLVQQVQHASKLYQRAKDEGAAAGNLAVYNAIINAANAEIRANKLQQQQHAKHRSDLEQDYQQILQQQQQAEGIELSETERVTVNNRIRNDITVALENPAAFREFLAKIGADTQSYTVTMKENVTQTIHINLVREMLLNKEFFQSLVDFINNTSNLKKEEIEAILNITFNRPGVSSINDSYARAVLSAVKARTSKMSGWTTDVETDAEELIKKQQFQISVRGKERNMFQLRQQAENQKEVILQDVYNQIDRLLDQQDKNYLNLAVLEQADELMRIMQQFGVTNLDRDNLPQLQQLMMLGRILSMRSLSFADELRSIMSDPAVSNDLLVAKILEFEGNVGNTARQDELSQLTQTELISRFMALNLLKLDYVDHTTPGFEQRYADLISTSDTNLDMLKRAYLTEDFIQKEINQQLNKRIKEFRQEQAKRDKQGLTTQALSDQRINQFRKEIENSPNILNTRSNMIGMELDELQNTLRFSLIRSGKYDAQVNQALAQKTLDLQNKYRDHDLINGHVDAELIRDAMGAVSLALLMERGYVYHDIQMLAGSLLANGGILNVGTGEGKTITSALALYIHALSGETAIQFLTQEAFANNDANEVRPFLTRLGVDVEVVTRQTDQTQSKELFMRRDQREAQQLPTTPRIVYMPFSDFAFMKLEDITRAEQDRVLPPKLAYANFDEIDALVFEGSLMDFINAEVSDALKAKEIQKYRLAWDFIMQIRSEGSEIAKDRDADKNFSLFRSLISRLASSVQDTSLYTIKGTKENKVVEFHSGSEIHTMIETLFTEAKQQGIDVGTSADEFKEIVRITLEQHLFHKEKVNWVLEDKLDQNGEVLRNDKGVVKDIKLIKSQGDHGNERQSNHRHTIMEVYAKYLMGVNIDVLGDSVTSGKIGGADVIKSFDKFSGFSGSIATEVAREEMEKLFGKDIIAEIPSATRKVIERRDSAVFATKQQANTYLLDQIKGLYTQRDGAPVLVGIRSEIEAENLYNTALDQFELQASEQLTALEQTIPANAQTQQRIESIREQILQFRAAAAVRSPDAAPGDMTKAELATQIINSIASIQRDMYASFIETFSQSLPALNNALNELRTQLSAAQQRQDITEIDRLNDQIGALQNVINNYSRYTAQLSNRDLKTDELEVANIIFRIVDAMPANMRDQFPDVSAVRTARELLYQTVDRMSKVFVFHGSSFTTEEEEKAFLELAGNRGSVTFISPYGTRGKDFKLNVFNMKQVDKIVRNDTSINAFNQYLTSNQAALEQLARLVVSPQSPDQANMTDVQIIMNKFRENPTYILYSGLESLISNFDTDRDAATRKAKGDAIDAYFQILKDAVSDQISDSYLSDVLTNEISQVQENFHVERQYGYQVFEMGVSLSERITIQLFGRGGRQKAPRTEQTIISLDTDGSEIATRAFEHLGARSGEVKHEQYLERQTQLGTLTGELQAQLDALLAGADQSTREYALDTLLQFDRTHNLDSIQKELSNQVQDYLIRNKKYSETAALEAAQKFVEKLAVGIRTKEEFFQNGQLDSTLLAEAQEHGLQAAHLEQLINVRFNEQAEAAHNAIIRAILVAHELARLKQDDATKDFSDTELKQRAQQIVADLQNVTQFDTLVDFINYVNTQFSNVLPAAITEVHVESMSDIIGQYAQTERDIASLFKDAQYFLDIIDSEKRTTKSYFDAVEYNAALEVGAIKSRIKDGTYETTDGENFKTLLNLNMVDRLFEEFEKSGKVDELQRNLRMVGLQIDDSITTENAAQIKEHLKNLIESGELSIVNDSLLDDAFRAANAELLKEWTSLKQKPQYELQQKLDEIKKQGLSQKQVSDVIDIAITTYRNSAKSPADFLQLRNDMAALGIEIGLEHSTPQALEKRLKEINSEISNGKITLDHLIVGGVLGEAFGAVTDALRDQVVALREQYAEQVNAAITEYRDNFETEINQSFENFVNSLGDKYLAAVYEKMQEILAEVEQSERPSTDLDFGERNTANIVSRAVGQTLINRRVSQINRLTGQQEVTVGNRAIAAVTKVAAVMDTALSTILGKFGITRTPRLITKKKAADVEFESIVRQVEAEEVSPAALYPNQSVQVVQTQRSLEDMREMVTPRIELGITDGNVVARELETGREIERQAGTEVSGKIVEFKEVNGQRTMVLDIQDMSMAADAIFAAIQADANAGRAGGIDVSRVELMVSGKQTVILDLGRSTFANLIEKEYNSALNNVLSTGGVLELNGELLVFAKNRDGVMEGHNFGDVAQVNPDILTVLEMKGYEQSGDMQKLIGMASNPFFQHIFQKDVFLENGVIVIGNSSYNKEQVGKGTLLIDARLGDNVSVGRGVSIINSEIGLHAEAASMIESGVQIRNAKIGREMYAQENAVITDVIANNLNVGTGAIVERVNSRTGNINVGDRSMLLDYEAEFVDTSLTIVSDHFQQGQISPVSYSDTRFEEIIVPEDGKIGRSLKKISRNFALKSQDTENKYLKQIYMVIAQLAGAFTVDGRQARQLAALQKERSELSEDIAKQFKDQRERLTNNQTIPYNLLFGLDPSITALSTAAKEVNRIVDISDPSLQREEMTTFVQQHFKSFDEPVQQKLIEQLLTLQSGEIVRPPSEILDNIDSIESIEELSVAEALVQFELITSPDPLLGHIDAAKVAYRRAQLAENEDVRQQYLIQAFSHNQKALQLDAANDAALQFEQQLLRDLESAGFNLSDRLSGINNRVQRIQQSLKDFLMQQAGLEESDAQELAGQLIKMINIQLDDDLSALGSTAIGRQILQRLEASPDSLPALTNLQTGAHGVVNAGMDTLDIDLINSILDKAGINPQVFLIDLQRTLDLNNIDSAAQWQSAESAWEDSLVYGSLTYGDPIFDAIKPSMKRFPTSVRNQVAHIILQSYELNGNGLGLIDDIQAKASALLERFQDGEFKGDALQAKSEMLFALYYTAVLLNPDNKDTLYGLTKAYQYMAQNTAHVRNINDLSEDELKTVLINAGVARSSEQAQQLAQNIAQQTATNAVLLIDDLTDLTAFQKHQLRIFGLGGAEEVSSYYARSGADLSKIALSIAQELKSSEVPELILVQISEMFNQESPDFKQITSLIEQAREALNLQPDKQIRQTLQNEIHFFTFKQVVAENADKTDGETLKAIQKAFSDVSQQSSSYPVAALMYTDILIAQNDFSAAQKLLSQISKKFPEYQGEISTKQISIQMTQGSMPSIFESIELSKDNELAAIKALQALQGTLSSQQTLTESGYMSDVLDNLLQWYTQGRSNGLSDSFALEVVQTIARLSDVISSAIVANLTNTELRAEVDRLITLQNQILDTLLTVQDASGITPLSSAQEFVAVVEQQKANLNIMPAVTVLRDNLDLRHTDETGFLFTEIQTNKTAQLNAFIQVFAPNAKVFTIGDQTIVIGLSTLHINLFTNLFLNGYQDSSISTLAEQIAQEVKNNAGEKDVTELAMALQIQWGISKSVARSIAALKDQSVSDMSSNLLPILNNILNLTDDNTQKLATIFPHSLQDTAIAALNTKIKTLTTDGVDKENIAYFETLINRVGSDETFTSGRYSLISGTKAIPVNTRSVKTPDQIAQNLIKPAFNEFEAVEQREIEKLAKTKTPPSVTANAPSNLGTFVTLWQNELQPGTSVISNNDLKALAEQRDVFQYFQKISQGASAQDLAALRPRIETIINTKTGYPIANNILAPLEQSNGNLEQAFEQWSSQMGQAIPQQMQQMLLTQVKQALLPGLPAEQVNEATISVESIGASYNATISTIFNTITAQKDQMISKAAVTITPAQQQIFTKIGVVEYTALTPEELAVLSSVADKMAQQNNALSIWLETQYKDLIDIAKVRDLILSTQGYKLLGLNDLQRIVLERVILKQNATITIDSDNTVYVSPEIDITTPERMEDIIRQLDALGIANPRNILFSDELSDFGIIFDLPTEVELFPISVPVVAIPDSVDAYLAQLFDDILSSAGFRILQTRNPQAAQMVKEYVSALKESRPVNTDKLDLAGARFIINIILNKVAVQQMMQDETYRSNPIAIRALRSMIVVASNVMTNILDSSIYPEYREQLDAQRSIMIGALAGLRQAAQQISLDIVSGLVVNLETLQQTQGALEGLNSAVESIITPETSVIVDQTSKQKNTFDYFKEEMSIDELELIKMSLKRVAGVIEVSKDELAEKFFEVVKSNAKRYEIFQNFITELGQASGSEKYITAAASLNSKITYYVKDVLGEGSNQALSDIYAARYVNNRVKHVLVQNTADSAIQQTIENVFELIGSAIGIDSSGTSIQAPILIQKLIRQLSELTGTDISQLVIQEQLRGSMGILFDEALEASTTDRILPQITTVLQSQNITEAAAMREAVINFMADVYLGVGIDPVYNQIFLNADGTRNETFVIELNRFLTSNVMIDKAPLLHDVAVLDSVTDKRIVFIQMMQDLLGAQLFAPQPLSDTAQQQAWSMLLTEITPVISQQASQDNRYVFAINFDTIAKQGKISVNESNFLIKDTMDFLTELGRSEGKDVRFVIMSDDSDTETIINSLSALRLSAAQIDVFGKNFNGKENNFVDLIDAVRQTYNIDAANLKVILNASAAQNSAFIDQAAQNGVQVMNVTPGVNIESHDDGAMYGITLVGGLNTLVRSSIVAGTQMPADLQVIDIRKAPVTNEVALRALLQEYEGLFTASLLKQPDFLARLKTMYETNLTDDKLIEHFFKDVVILALNNDVALTDTSDVASVVEQLKQALTGVFGNTFMEQLMGMEIFLQQLQGSMVNLVLQPPKQRISNTYLREYEKMKMAEEFA